MFMYKRIGKTIYQNNEFNRFLKIFNFKILILVSILLYGDLIFPFSYNKIKTFQFLFENKFNNFKINKDINF